MLRTKPAGFCIRLKMQTVSSSPTSAETGPMPDSTVESTSDPPPVPPLAPAPVPPAPPVPAEPPFPSLVADDSPHPLSARPQSSARNGADLGNARGRNAEEE